MISIDRAAQTLPLEAFQGGRLLPTVTPPPAAMAHLMKRGPLTSAYTPSDAPLSKRDLYLAPSASGPHLRPVESVGSAARSHSMQNRTEMLGATPHQRLLRSSATYLAKVAVVLQEAPGKMLTFSQLMDKMAPRYPEDRKSFENNIRVCLSTNKCFVKIPMVQGSAESKRNHWKLDCSQITAKMVRRHFKGILHLFPELASKVETENVSRRPVPCSTVPSPKASACRSVQTRPVKFSGPFSIESLLRRASPSARSFRASPLSGLQVKAEQHPGRSPVCPAGGSTLHGLAVDGATAHVSGRHPSSELLFPGYAAASAALYFSSYITHPVPAFTHDALYFRL